MKFYRVKPEFVDQWTVSGDCELIVSENEIKSLAKEWGMTIKELKEQADVIKPEVAKVERYWVGEYFVEVEEKYDPIGGHMFDFWLGKERFGVKDYMFGLPVNQPNAKDGKASYVKNEILEIGLANVWSYIEMFRDEYED